MNGSDSWLYLDDVPKENLKDYIEEYQNAIDNYDAYMEQVNQLAKTINDYNNLPTPFRQNIDKWTLKIH